MRHFVPATVAACLGFRDAVFYLILYMAHISIANPGSTARHIQYIYNPYLIQ